MRVIISLIAVGLLGYYKQIESEAGQEASPSEVIEKVDKAVRLLEEKGAAGLDVIRDADSEFSWKDSYVFVVNCEADRVMANAAFPDREGGDIKVHTDYNGKQYGLELCEAANSSGRWIEYVWLKPGGKIPMRKISFVRSVENYPYQVGQVYTMKRSP